MTITHGFKLETDRDIKELKTQARLYRHEKTGAELLSLINNDENKVFGITFRTPPVDSTGIAHILEHSVLCGSRKYPVKEPFVELLKGSLNTFLNAFTYPDKTCYPVASQNLQDFYNLIDVYLDAVFYPHLTPFIFQQEGWHFELEDSGKPITYKGVVFNEMKGAYSSPDNILVEKSQQSLFPDNTYGLDSGGNPKHIPDLTFEQFRAFHQRYYHPSNARIYFYGDDDPETRLKLANGYLKAFDPILPDSTIPLQPPFQKPGHMEHPFMVGEEEVSKAKGMVTLNWLLPETTSVQTNFALRVLEYALLGMPGSPLRKALIDSGLGEDIAGEGLATELRQMYFSTGLKGIDIKNTGQVESLVTDTLADLARKGIDPLTIEAALNTIEFGLRENNTGHFPRGLLLMLRSLTTWLYDGDPLALLAFEEPLEAVKSGARSESGLFEQMINRFFLANPHRTTLTLKPDPDLRETEEAGEKERLATARSAMGPDKVTGVLKNTRELKRLQETPDPPEALATIPVLKLEDLEKKNTTIPISHFDRQGAPVLFHDLFTNGIAYLDLGFNLRALPDKYLPYVSLFGRALVEIGTDKEDFVTLTQRISRKTGGIGPQTFTSTIKDSKQCAAWLFLCGKAMLKQTEDLVNILQDVLLTVRFDNRDRFRQMVLEAKARAEQNLVPRGHQIVNLRIRSHFGESHRVAEQMGGLSYLFFLRKLVLDVEKDWDGVLSVLTDMRRILVNRGNMIFNVTLDNDSWSGFEKQVNRFIDALPHGPVTKADWAFKAPAPFEGMTVPSQVNYVGKGANLFDIGYGFHGSSLVITRYLRNTFLWDRVRVQGGAYGAFCLLDRMSGALTFVSYRDPNLLDTIETFDRSASFLEDMDLGEEELTKSIIGAIGDLDSHMLPDAKGFASMVRYLTGDTEEARQRIRDEILGTKASDFKDFARMLEQVKEKGIVKILGSPNAIEKATTERPGWLDIVKVL
ncbi:MAG: insulinase family protein [Desulfobacterales bacterium]|nr:insulinase family protein [Desulfobacterales bacterium]